MNPKVVAVSISKKKGQVKTPVQIGEVIENFGLKDDAHSGNWHRQVSLLMQESIDYMKTQGLPDLKPGDFAENITTTGIELYTLPLGTKLQIGKDVILGITQIGKECHTGCAIFQKVGKCIMPKHGIFTKVIKGGFIQAEDEIKVL